MKKHILTVLATCGLVSTTCYAQPEKSPFEFEVTQGFRRDHIKAHAKLKALPIKGHASLKNIKIYETRVRSQINMANYFLRLNAGYGDVLKSQAKFSALGFHHTHRITGGRTLDGKISFGRKFFLNKAASLSPMVGVLGGEEKIHFAKISYPKWVNHVLHHFGVHKKINKDKITHPKWKWGAPFVGLGTTIKPGIKWSLYGEYNFACLPLTKIKGHGHIGLVSLGYDLTKHITLKAEYEHSRLRVHYTNHYAKTHGTLISSTARLALNYAF